MNDLPSAYRQIRQNAKGIAGELMTAYRTPQLAPIIKKVERFVIDNKGDVSDLHRAIKVGAKKRPSMSGLGIVAETAGSSVTLASIIAIINQIDWDNLSSAWENDSNDDGGSGDSPGAVPREGSPSGSNSQIPQKSKGALLPQKQGGSSSMGIVITALVLAGGGYYLYKKKQEQQ